MQNPDPHLRMLKGFHQDWIPFEQSRARVLKAQATLESVLRDPVERSA